MPYHIVPTGRRSARRLLSTAEMRAIDARAIEALGLPGLLLMENAARHVARVAAARTPAGGRVVVVCGRGNNGGDGLAAARHLRAWGYRVDVVLAAEPDRLSPDAAVHWQVLEAAGATRRVVDALPLFATLPGPGTWDLVVDAVLGTGLKGPARGLAREAISWINAQGAPVVAVDVPSGLNGDTGRAEGVAVQAAATVTFAASKLGHWLGEAPERIGALHIVDIGLPHGLIESGSAPRTLLGTPELQPAFAPRPTAAHKGWAGHVYVLAGGLGQTGAARMAADAALTAGAGLVTIGTTAEALPGLGPQLYEVMAEAALTGDPEADAARVVAQGNRRSAMIVGPGLPATPELTEVLRAALPRVTVPVVIDAEGLNRFVGEAAELGRGGPRVITPHPGEAGRLLGISAAQVQADRLGAVSALVAQTGAVVVLKGAHTLVAAPDGRLGLCPDGNPGMASAGMGDVLAGIVGALLARGLAPYEAACAAVIWHARAGDRAAVTSGHNGLRAGALIEALPTVELETC